MERFQKEHVLVNGDLWKLISVAYITSSNIKVQEEEKYRKEQELRSTGASTV